MIGLRSGLRYIVLWFWTDSPLVNCDACKRWRQNDHYFLSIETVMSRISYVFLFHADHFLFMYWSLGYWWALGKVFLSLDWRRHEKRCTESKYCHEWIVYPKHGIKKEKFISLICTMYTYAENVAIFSDRYQTTVSMSIYTATCTCTCIKYMHECIYLSIILVNFRRFLRTNLFFSLTKRRLRNSCTSITTPIQVHVHVHPILSLSLFV